MTRTICRVAYLAAPPRVRCRFRSATRPENPARRAARGCPSPVLARAHVRESALPEVSLRLSGPRHGRDGEVVRLVENTFPVHCETWAVATARRQVASRYGAHARTAARAAVAAGGGRRRAGRGGGDGVGDGACGLSRPSGVVGGAEGGFRARSGVYRSLLGAATPAQSFRGDPDWLRLRRRPLRAAVGERPLALRRGLGVGERGRAGCLRADPYLPY